MIGGPINIEVVFVYTLIFSGIAFVLLWINDKFKNPTKVVIENGR